MGNAKTIGEKVPPLADLEVRFHFIRDKTLQQNVALTFQYTIFLIALLNEVGAEGSSIASSTHKDLITHTACVVEACTHYVLHEYVRLGKVTCDDIMPKEDRFTDVKLIYTISPEERIIAARQIQKVEKYSGPRKLDSVLR